MAVTYYVALPFIEMQEGPAAARRRSAIVSMPQFARPKC